MDGVDVCLEVTFLGIDTVAVCVRAGEGRGVVRMVSVDVNGELAAPCIPFVAARIWAGEGMACLHIIIIRRRLAIFSLSLCRVA